MQNTAQQSKPAPAKRKPQAPKPVPPPEFQAAKIITLDEAGLISLLKKSNATEFEKAKACQRLANVGTAEAVPALSALLTDPRLSTYARYGLEPIPGPAVDDSLRQALPKLKGTLLVGVINSLGMRKDANAVPPLSKLLFDSDPAVAQASAAALGHISGPEAAKVLEAALDKTKGPLRAAVADGALICAEGLLERGNRDEAMALYNTLTAVDVPKPARLAAMHGIIGAETSLSRPR